jgi:hypothetical protein
MCNVYHLPIGCNCWNLRTLCQRDPSFGTPSSFYHVVDNRVQMNNVAPNYHLLQCWGWGRRVMNLYSQCSSKMLLEKLVFNALPKTWPITRVIIQYLANTSAKVLIMFSEPLLIEDSHCFLHKRFLPCHYWPCQGWALGYTVFCCHSPQQQK